MLQLIIIVVLLVALLIWVGQQLQEAKFRWVANNYHRRMRQMGMGGMPFMPPYGMPYPPQSSDNSQGQYDDKPTKPVVPVAAVLIIFGLVIYLVSNYQEGKDPSLDVVVSNIEAVSSGHAAVANAYDEIEKGTAMTALKAEMQEAPEVQTAPAVEETPSFQADFTAGFTVQAIFTHDFDRATEWAKMLTDEGYGVRYQDILSNGKLGQRLLVGNAEQKAGLNEIKSRLENMGFEKVTVMSVAKLSEDGKLLEFAF